MAEKKPQLTATQKAWAEFRAANPWTEEMPAIVLGEVHATFMQAWKLCLAHLGQPGKCDGCGAAILWVRTRNDKRCPYSPDTGNSHFADCPKAGEFSRKTPRPESP